jgi:NTP pyrophosphatase (non-canonical NTP hydrolase)
MTGEGRAFWNDYQAQAQRTSPDGHDRLLCGTMGLIGESGELVDELKKWMFQSGENAPLPREKLLSEAGDVLWYVVETITGFRGPAPTLDILLLAATILCSTRPYTDAWNDKKRFVIPSVGMVEEAILAYEENNENAIVPHLIRLLSHMQRLANKLDTTMEEIANRNIEKLRKRYPDGFDPERSLNRTQS